MPLSNEEVLHIARLARLQLRDDEVEHYSRELTVILDYIAQLAAVDTAGIEVQPQLSVPGNVFRDDSVRPSLDRDLVLRSAPLHDGEYFMVPKVIGS